MPILARRAEVWRPVVEVTTDPTPPPPPPPPPVTSFAHPGVMYSAAQLDFVKQQLAGGAQPWTGAYNTMLTRTAGSGANNTRAYSSTAWVPTPIPEVGRGAYGNPAQGDADLQHDCKAALCHALIWYYKGTRANGEKAVEILNAWSRTLTRILFDTVTWKDGKLLAGWTGTVFARAAEIMRYSYTPTTGKPALDVTNLIRMFNNVYWPLVGFGHNGGGHNTLTSMMDTMVQIAVFCDDRPKFDTAVNFWRDNIKSVIWMRGDDNPYTWGNPTSFTYANTTTAANFPNGLPLPPKGTMYDKAGVTASSFMSGYWHSPTSLPDGLEGETGRDLHHMAMGHAGLINTAETVRHQGHLGINLYAEQAQRLIRTFELNCQFIYERWMLARPRPTGWPYNKDVVGYQTAFQRATYEIGYQQLGRRMGNPMPNTERFLTEYSRPSTHKVDLFLFMEYLTHFGTP